VSFIDEYMPDEVPGYPCISAPRTNTSIQVSAGGGEHRNQNWEHPLHRFILPEAIARQSDVINDLKKHWLIMRGPFNSFPWPDPLDWATLDHSPNVLPVVTLTDQQIGTADGFTDRFQLVKTYTVGSETYDRTIHLPVLASVLVAIDGVIVSASDYTVSRPGGEILFDTPPAAPSMGHPQVITAGFLFDVEVRFESDDAFEGILRTYQVGGFADITLIEVRPC
jgi:uncharacterized protein (TIGR02217 family)